jgi:hypothetical protein
MSNAHAMTTGPPKSRSEEQQGRGKASAEKGQDQRLGQVMLHQAPAARTHRHPDGQLPLADRAAGQHHARDVQPDHEQDDAGQSKEDHARSRHLGSQSRAGREVGLDATSFVRIGRRISGGQGRHRRLDGGVCLRHRRARRQPRDDTYPVGLAIEARIVGREARMM